MFFRVYVLSFNNYSQNMDIINLFIFEMDIEFRSIIEKLTLITQASALFIELN